MNVTDQWMLERMQQMAANMAAGLQQNTQSNETAKTEKGESFQDLMNKTKDQKLEAPKKDSPDRKTEAVQDKAPAQETQPKKITDMRDPRIQALDPVTQAQIAAGFTTAVEGSDGGLFLMVSMEPQAIIVHTLPSGELDLTKPIVLTNGKGEEFEVYLDQENGDHKLFQVMENGVRKELDLFPEQPKLNYLEDPKNLNRPVIDSEGKTTTLGELLQRVRAKDSTDSQEEGEDTSDLDAELMNSGEPLFKDVKAAPVKVGENFQLDTQKPDMEQQLANTIRTAAQQGLREIEIKLSPENLGNLTIKLTQASDGSLQVVLHASDPKAANLLGQHLDNLNAALQGYNHSEVHVEVQRNENGQQAQQQFQHQADPDGHNQQQRQQQEQQQQQDNSHNGDFFQKLRLGLFGLEDVI